MDDAKKVQEFESLMRSQRKGMSRRDFLKTGLALGLSIPAASGVIATILGAPVRAFAQDATEAAAKGGQGTLVVEQSGDPVSFNLTTPSTTTVMEFCLQHPQYAGHAEPGCRSRS